MCDSVRPMKGKTNKFVSLNTSCSREFKTDGCYVILKYAVIGILNPLNEGILWNGERKNGQVFFTFLSPREKIKNNARGNVTSN